MSVNPSSFNMLSALENEKCNNLSACLAKLGNERNQLESELQVAQRRRRDIDEQKRDRVGKSIKASELAIWERADQELEVQMGGISERLSELHHEEKKLRLSLSSHLGKHHTWETLIDNETKKKKRLLVQSDQRSVDDLIAHRPRRPV